MQDTKLFETILGITAPWQIARVELKTEDKRVDLWLEHEPTRWPCPDCGELFAGFDLALTMPKSARGDISTRASFRRTCMRKSLGCSAPRTASSKCGYPGPSRGVALRC